MSFNCRICKGKLLSTIFYDGYAESSTTVSTFCGHLFHNKCLEASLTNQKLVHAREGTGPFRRKCPKCDTEFSDSEIIVIRNEIPLMSQDSQEDDESEVQLKLLKRINVLNSDKEKMGNDLNNLRRENENYRDALDEIKVECDEIRSVLVDDGMMKKGDRVFCIMEEGSYAPGRILEMRKKSAQANKSPYAVVKLDRKTKVLGQERETVIIPVDALITFKFFFTDFFDEFRRKIGRILTDAEEGMTHDGRQKLLRSKFRESSLRLSFDWTNSKSPNDSFPSPNHESVEAIPQEMLNLYKAHRASFKAKNTSISRSKTVQFGDTRPKPQFFEKYRSVSVSCKSSPMSETSEMSFMSDDGRDVSVTSPTSSMNSENNRGLDYSFQEENLPVTEEYISIGERVIWFDPHSEHPLVGEVAAVLQYTPCAIVKFDQLPGDNQIYEFRTAPLEQLFPYDLASPEEKFRIAQAYGKVAEYMEHHAKIFEEDESRDGFLQESGRQDDDEYFSTSSNETEMNIIVTHVLPL